VWFLAATRVLRRKFVIVLTDGIPTPAVSEVISKYSIPWIQRDRLAMDLWPSLDPMVYPQLALRRVTKAARLVLDTFMQLGWKCRRSKVE